MAKSQRTVIMDEELDERFESFREDRNFDMQTRALCKAIDEGLRAMGYQPTYTTNHDRWLALTRGMGTVLGLTALILFGSGTFLGPMVTQYGFGLAVASIGFFAGAELADRHGSAMYHWLADAIRSEAQHWQPSDGGGR